MSNSNGPWGIGPNGFTPKPVSVILAEMQQSIWDNVDSDLDLSPQTPDGQMLGLIANQAGAAWELLQVCYNQYNREDAEGASLDNLGDVTGTPRAGETFAQILCTLTISAANAPYPPGALVANVSGQPSQTYANAGTITASMITAGVAMGILFEAQTIGPVPTVNPGSLTQITAPVAGWTAVVDQNGSFEQGLAEESDAAYAVRQAQEVAASGSCNPSALAEALRRLAASPPPPATPVALAVSVLTNTSNETQVIQGVALPAHSFQVVLFENDTQGWIGGPGGPLIGAVIWENTPSGISSYGDNPQTVDDPVLGTQTVYWSAPTQLPLYISANVVVASAYKGTFAQLTAAIQAALVAAAVAPTPATGIPPTGQLMPGSFVIGAQLQAVIMGVPGVADVKALTFDFTPAPTNTQTRKLSAAEIATLAESTVATNVVITPGTYP